MTQPDPDELLTLATPYALHAVGDAEAAEIARRLAAAPAQVANAFVGEVRATRETMAAISASTALEPPPELRVRLLNAVEGVADEDRGGRSAVQARWRVVVLAAAAAISIGLAAIGLGLAMRPAPQTAAPPIAERVLSAPDVRTVSGQLTAGGTATLVFSREQNAGVLVMNNVVAPNPGSVYQMWLVGTKGAISAGTLDAAAARPSAKTVVSDLGDSQVLAFTVEPSGGSAQPTTPIFAKFALA